MSLDDENITAQPKPSYQLQSNTIIWADFFELIIFTTVPLSVYRATVIQYNFYK